MSELRISESLAEKIVETNALIPYSEDRVISILTPDGVIIITAESFIAAGEYHGDHPPLFEIFLTINPEAREKIEQLAKTVGATSSIDSINSNIVVAENIENITDITATIEDKWFKASAGLLDSNALIESDDIPISSLTLSSTLLDIADPRVFIVDEMGGQSEKWLAYQNKLRLGPLASAGDDQSQGMSL